MTAATGEAARRAAEALVARIRTEIPLTQAMALAVAHCDGEALVLRVPLAPNVNDKGTAFAGSITALGSITGWCLLTLWAERVAGGAQVALYDARFSFRQPLRGDFEARARLPDADECEALARALARRGKGRVTLEVTLADAGGVAVTVTAAYALWKVPAA